MDSVHQITVEQKEDLLLFFIFRAHLSYLKLIFLIKDLWYYPEVSGTYLWKLINHQSSFILNLHFFSNH